MLSYIKTSQLIGSANKLTCFYMRATVACDGLTWICIHSIENPKSEVRTHERKADVISDFRFA